MVLDRRPDDRGVAALRRDLRGRDDALEVVDLRGEPVVARRRARDLGEGRVAQLHQPVLDLGVALDAVPGAQCLDLVEHGARLSLPAEQASEDHRAGGYSTIDRTELVTADRVVTVRAPPAMRGGRRSRARPGRARASPAPRPAGTRPAARPTPRKPVLRTTGTPVELVEPREDVGGTAGRPHGSRSGLGSGRRRARPPAPRRALERPRLDRQEHGRAGPGHLEPVVGVLCEDARTVRSEPGAVAWPGRGAPCSRRCGGRRGCCGARGRAARTRLPPWTHPMMRPRASSAAVSAATSSLRRKVVAGSAWSAAGTAASTRAGPRKSCPGGRRSVPPATTW